MKKKRGSCLSLTLLRIGIKALAGRDTRRLYGRGRNSDRTVREDLLTGSIRDIDTPRHALDVGQLIVGRALLVRRRMFLFAARPLRRFSGLVMTQMANIALYTSGAGPFLHESKLVSRHIRQVRNRTGSRLNGQRVY